MIAILVGLFLGHFGAFFRLFLRRLYPLMKPCQPKAMRTTSVKKSIGFIFACVSVSVALPTWSWSDHASLVWPLLRTQPNLIEQTVTAEPLEQFLITQQVGIAQTLESVETWSLKTIAHYPATPESLRWSLSNTPTPADFFAAIRVNPTLAYRLYVYEPSVQSVAKRPPLPWQSLSFLRGGDSQLAARYRSLAAGESVAIAEVIASASDEPDFGMDVGLFEDNGTAFGAVYGFGVTPFGNDNLDYGSQAPFHMGFYHLDWLTRTAQPDLLRTYPLWRIALFGELADLAFRTGHDYWGWRFLGWGLHYVGDLTQPYHTVPLPGISTFDGLLLVARGKTGEAIQLVSNRHGVIESYQYHRLTRALVAGDWSAPLLLALSAQPADKRLSYDVMVGMLTAASVDAAAAFDAVIEANVPDHFVSDPAFEWTGSGYESGVVEHILEQKGPVALQRLDDAVILQLQRFSVVASRWLARGGVKVE